METKKKMSRRAFLGRTAAAAAAVGIGAVPATGDAVEEKPSIQAYRPLGKTGWKVSDVSFGNAGMKEPTLLEYAMERGINYVDTARQYYDMEKVIGKIFPQKRDKIFVTTKLEPEIVTADVSVGAVTTAIEESLERLNTDYIDCCLIHSVGDPNLGDHTRARNPNVHEAFERARKAGKIRFYGASSHGPKMFDDFNWLIDNTNIDMIMAGMNYMTRGLEPVLAKAKKKGIAVVGMKSLSAARKIDFSAYKVEGRTVRQALIKWMLAQANIDTIAVTMRTFEDVDEFVAASGRVPPGEADGKVLEEFGALFDTDYCRPGCDRCTGACPHGVPIHDIMRYRLYFEGYGREKYAMGLYGAVPASRSASLCGGCAAPCAGSCPFGIPIQDKLIEAHRQLTA